MILGAVMATLLHAQDTEKKGYPKAHAVESSSDETPAPKKKKAKKTPSPSPKPKAKTSKTASDEDESPPPKKKKSTSARAKSSATPEAKAGKAKPEKTPTQKSKSSKKKTAKKKPTTSAEKSKAKKKPTPEEDETPAKRKSKKPPETPAPKPEATAPRAVAVPTPNAPPAPVPAAALQPRGDEPEQLTIEKSGYEKPRSFWERVFGGGGRTTTSSGAGYRYLTSSIRAAIDRVGADRRNPRWQLIVVHNSGTRQGNARVFDYYHRHVRHMQNGLAYHFVIGNGTSTGNGQIEVGDRWRRQINGGHVHSDYLNNIAIGICLVGDFNRDQPTRAQLDCCEELIRYLRMRCGRFDNAHFPIVKPHREANPPRWGTDCPGDAFPYSWFRRFRE